MDDDLMFDFNDSVNDEFDSNLNCESLQLSYEISMYSSNNSLITKLIGYTHL